jgi:hypothetical protein
MTLTKPVHRPRKEGMNSPSRLTLLAGLLLLAPSLARTSAEEPAPAAPAATSTATPAAAPASPAAEPANQGRELGGHVFMPTLGIQGPFAVTSFGTFLTLGEGSTVASSTIQLPSGALEPVSGSVTYVAIGGVLAYEYEFLRGVSARIGISESLYSGTTGLAVAVVGTNARLGFGAGLTAGMTLGDSLRLSAVADVTSAPRLGLLLGPALQAFADSCRSGLTDCTFDFGLLFQQENVIELQPGVAVGWAPLKSLGVTGNLSYSYSSIKTKGGGSASQSGVSAGAAVDFDFGAVSRVPVGLQLTWASLVPVSGEGNTRYTDIGGGLFYTGRKDLSLGLQLVVRRFRVVPEVDVSWTTVMSQVGLRYFW